MRRRGKARWAHELSEFGGEIPGWAYAESVLIYKDLAIVTPGGDRCIVALDKKTGRPVWSSSRVPCRRPIRFLHRRRLSRGRDDRRRHGRRHRGGGRRNGHMLWANPFSAQNTANCPTPAFADGYVFWANGYDKGGICLQLDVRGKNVAATEAWTTRDMVCHHGGYIIHEGHIYGNHAESWVCLDLRTGRAEMARARRGQGLALLRRRHAVPVRRRTGASGTGHLFARGLEMRGEVTVEGQEKSWAHPVVIGGRLYLRYEDNLYCFNVRAVVARRDVCTRRGT